MMSPPFGRAISHEWRPEAGLDRLNHGSFGATPRAVLAGQERWRLGIRSSAQVYRSIERYERLAEVLLRSPVPRAS